MKPAPDREALRALGHAIVDAAVDRLAGDDARPAPAPVETEVVSRLASWLGLPHTAAGAIMGTRSEATLLGLACARARLSGPASPDLVYYAGDQAHSSLAQAARLLGLRPEQLRVLPSDPQLRLRVGALEAAMDADIAAGLRPFAVCANGGTAATGAVDPLREIAALCRRRGVWLHVDAVFGGLCVLVARGREALAGLEQADSVTLDPAGALDRPSGAYALLVRDGEAALETLPPEEAELGGVRGLAARLSLPVLGTGAFEESLERTFDAADAARARLAASSGLELLAGGPLPVLCLRRAFPEAAGEAARERLQNAVLAAVAPVSGGLLTATRSRGGLAMRLSVPCGADAAARVEALLEALERAEVDDVRPPQEEPRPLATLAFFQALSSEEAGRVLGLARERALPAGETVVEQWETSRDFYVVLEGSLSVVADGRRIADLGPGDFFGELAALDWSSGFGYPRLATVSALTDCRLLAFPDGLLNQLVRELPGVDRIVRDAVRQRLERRRAEPA